MAGRKALLEDAHNPRLRLGKQAPLVHSGYEGRARVVLYHGEAISFLRGLPDASVQLVVTSPPYNVGKAYESRTGLQHYLARQYPVIVELSRVLKPSGSICWQVGNYLSNSGEVFPLDVYYYQIFKELGFQLRNRIVWHFRHGLHATNRLSGRYETILWLTKARDYTFNLDAIRIPSRYPGKRHYKGPKKGKPSGNPNGKNPSDFWEIVRRDWETGIWDIPNVKANHPEKTVQPCQFPVELVERCVLAFSKKGDRVLDPFAGVASTLIGALMHGRRALGAEKEKSYCRIAVSRLNLFFKGKLRLRALGTPVKAPTGTEKVAQVPSEWKRSAYDI